MSRRWGGPRTRAAGRASAVWAVAPGIAALGVAAALARPALLAAQDIAVRAGTVHTVGPAGTLEDGVVLVRDGRIVVVGPASEVEVPAGVELLEYPEGVVTPGLVNIHSTVGLAGIYNTPHDQDLAERTTDANPELRALDGFNYKEPLVSWVRGLGTTTLHAVPGGDGPTIAGQGAAFKTWGDETDAMVVRAPSVVAFQLGEGPKGLGGYPNTRMGVVAVIRAELEKARRYAERWAAWRSAPEGERGAAPDRDLGLEALVRVLDGEVPAMITARREDDILTALRLQREFGFRLILDAATEGYLVADRIAEAGASVAVGPVLEREASLETENVSLENAAILASRGVPVAIQTGYDAYVPKTHVVLFEAAMAAVNGLGFDGALEAVTLSPARMLGIDDRVGSLEPGKDGDLVVFGGDPFEYLTPVELVVGGGGILRRGEVEFRVR